MHHSRPASKSSSREATSASSVASRFASISDAKSGSAKSRHSNVSEVLGNKIVEVKPTESESITFS